MPTTLADALGNLASQTQHVIVGDSEHTDSRIPKTLGDPAALEALANSGVKHMFLELPSGRQPLLDMLTDGTITPTGFAKTMADDPLSMRDERGWQAIGELAQQAAQKHGMKVYAADERADRLQEFITKAREGLGTTQLDFENVAAYMKRVEPYTQPDGTVEGPLTNDRPLADFISRHAGNEKTVTLFGESHGGRKYDLDEMLGDAKRCQLFASQASLAESQKEYQHNKLGYEAAPDPPALRYFIDSKKLEINGQPVQESPSMQSPPAMLQPQVRTQPN